MAHVHPSLALKNAADCPLRLLLCRAVMVVLLLVSGHLAEAETTKAKLKPLPFDTTWRSRRILTVADSGFARRRYSEAYQQYNYLLQRREVYTPQMLLKMAAFSETDNNYTLALYYLNLYYLLNPSSEVRQKIEDVAATYNLGGYTFSELDYFIFLYNQYFVYISSTHVAIATLFLLIMAWRRYKGKALMYYPFFFLGFLLAGIFTANFGLLYRRGIVANDNTLLMEGPSVAASVEGTLDKGHKVIIKDKTDIWYKVEWQGKEAWLNRKNVLLIENL